MLRHGGRQSLFQLQNCLQRYRKDPDTGQYLQILGIRSSKTLLE